MTANDPNNGDTDVPENFSAEEPQHDAEPLESPGSSTAAETPVTENPEAETPEAETPVADFDIDLGSYQASREDDVDINLDFGGATIDQPPQDDFELDFGSLATTEEPEVAEEEPEEESDAAQEALEAFRSELRAKPGDWYVVHTYSGMENRVLQNLENRVSSLNMEDYIYEIVVPTEEVTEIRNGQRKQVRRTVLPGYVLVRMDLTDESWSTVRHTPSVTGFVGHSNSPVALSLDEVEKMLAPAVVAAANAASDTPSKRKKKIEVADF
ncbi:MAG TPA: transcription termination/antitermination NusG family protein, partial [Propionibacteriaceae bacterium]|nr:transcription termination/antitermination NusG family protein [Propionibacteriaceae bacterium]